MNILFSAVFRHGYMNEINPSPLSIQGGGVVLTDVNWQEKVEKKQQK